MEIKVCEKQELIQKKKIRFIYERHQILVIASDQGFYAIRDKCPHMGASLFPGKLEGTVIQCKDHGLRIDLKTASVIDDGKPNKLHMSESDCHVRAYRIIEKDNGIWVEI